MLMVEVAFREMGNTRERNRPCWIELIGHVKFLMLCYIPMELVIGS